MEGDPEKESSSALYHESCAYLLVLLQWVMEGKQSGRTNTKRNERGFPNREIDYPSLFETEVGC
jgi:hypothetical protein